MKTLVVIDVQNDFLPGGSLAVKDGDKIVGPIVELMKSDQWHRVVVTRDWHPPNHISFAKVHGKEPYDEIEYQWPGRRESLGRAGYDPSGELPTQKGTLWPVHCVSNTVGSQLAPKILDFVRDNHVKIVDKGFLRDREYYSAFADIWNLHQTDLDEYLRKHHTDELYIVGLAMDFCVMHTAIDGAKRGYNTTVLKDYTKPIHDDPQSLQKTEKNLTDHGVHIK